MTDSLSLSYKEKAALSKLKALADDNLIIVIHMM